MIQDIAIEQLDIHPQNVRKVYTDIDELAESIKARGVMQNLTVVPNPDKKDHYLVVIGNRRLTAARKAGLKTMPCSVVEMTEKRANINDAVGKHAAQRSISKRASTRIPAHVGFGRNRNNNRGKDRI